MPKQMKFDDNSFIEWVDRESLKYIEGEFSVLIWVDFEPGFLSKGRIIKASSVQKWSTAPENCSQLIDKQKKIEIIEKTKQYYKSLNKKCRVED